MLQRRDPHRGATACGRVGYTTSPPTSMGDQNVMLLLGLLLATCTATCFALFVPSCSPSITNKGQHCRTTCIVLYMPADYCWIMDRCTMMYFMYLSPRETADIPVGARKATCFIQQHEASQSIQASNTENRKRNRICIEAFHAFVRPCISHNSSKSHKCVLMGNAEG